MEYHTHSQRAIPQLLYLSQRGSPSFRSYIHCALTYSVLQVPIQFKQVKIKCTVGWSDFETKYFETFHVVPHYCRTPIPKLHILMLEACDKGECILRFFKR